MILYKTGSIFNSEADFLVNAVNCVGIMGKGIALEFKNRYKDMFLSYKKCCEQGLLKPGLLQIYSYKDVSILNFPTKVHWKDPSELEYIELGLKKFVDTYKDKNIKSIAFPQIGCGYGGLNWNDVHNLMIKYLSDLDCEIEIWTLNKKEKE